MYVIEYTLYSEVVEGNHCRKNSSYIHFSTVENLKIVSNNNNLRGCVFLLKTNLYTVLLFHTLIVN